MSCEEALIHEKRKSKTMHFFIMVDKDAGSENANIQGLVASARRTFAGQIFVCGKVRENAKCPVCGFHVWTMCWPSASKRYSIEWFALLICI